jgi:hypothetical protein
MRIDIVARQRVSPQERSDMYSLFARYYDNVNRATFEGDLDDKQWVLHLRNPDGCIAGFSTLQVYAHSGSAGPAVILYSGDTIVERACRRHGDLAGAFGHLLLRAVREHPGIPVYWLLTTKGVRTYRFLPVFFKTFYPAFDRRMPNRTRQLLDEVAAAKFGPEYSPATHIVSHHGRRDWLCAAERDAVLERRSDPHIRFFLEKNPGYVKGDELACISEMSEENLNKRGWRVIERTEVHWRE